MDLNATREILWNIPSELKYSMYALFFISIVLMLYGLNNKLSFALGENALLNFKSLIPNKVNWKKFLKTLFLSGKVPRFKNVAFFHGLIFFGFLILWIATDIVAIHADSPFKIYHGTLYIIISFLADFAGIAVLSGIYLAFKRRYKERPKYLKATLKNQEKFMYAMLTSLVVLGFLLEGLRILGTGLPTHESIYSPIGFILATMLNLFNLQDSTLISLYQSIWAIHMLNTMFFIASLGYSKFSHILFLPFSALIHIPKRGAILSPMNFEDENAETFGLGKISELSTKNKFDLLICVECGRCSQVCPALNSDKPLDPKLIITKMRDFALPLNEKKEDGDFWQASLYSFDELDSCTTCGACMEECPAHIEHIDLILNLKRYKTLTLGEIPPAAADAIAKIRNNGNPWGISAEDRFKWADGLDIPIAEPKKHIDYLYYIGCAGSYDSSNQQVVKDTISLLKKANVNFAVIGKTEKCNGDPIRRFGDEYTFNEIALENIEMLNKYDFDAIVTHCPHCLHTIGKEYPKISQGNFKTIHHTELLASLIKSKQLIPSKSVNKEFTFHDPCYLGRHHGQYNAPREILNSIPGLTLTEMQKSKDTATCCGMGGGNMWYEIEEGQHVVQNRLNEINETKAQNLATACSFCLINFSSSKAQNKQTENLEIEDISSILNKSI